MRIWQVVFLMNLALVVGLGFGYGVWGHRVAALDGELKTCRRRWSSLSASARCAAGVRAGQQQWEGHGIVRAVYPQSIPGHP